ncbi:tRNA (uridine(54)-C5)-methyltransferase TrmA [Candidatus Palibaumannia cicadellinicola]|uniref:tRNA/tmRNA (uracil-C(5))-methyltransferase n=1 Tax=Candidatus Palibaumannia cicadellinicola TaxID=186490 RepID=A0A0K2BKN4_9GAMM|nr:tRNA (uridine(54)-C5)-methyltransferase TrmA [Candidatus Baumannia cicadellinicola]AKZ65754.1 tRNA (Uracil54-C5-)-methyltransferase [Candidatus Baumannia cicadellinicola]
MTPAILPVADYNRQLQEKAIRLQKMMANFNAPNIKIFASEPIHYRMRAEFRVWHDNDQLFHIIFDQQTKQRIRVNYFMAGSMLMNELMSYIITAVQNDIVLRTKLFQIEYLTTTSGEALITLIYHRSIETKEWRNHASMLLENLFNLGYKINIIGRSAKTKICINYDYVEEYITVSGIVLNYRQIDNIFTQPNTGINIKMLDWVLSLTIEAQGDLLELYCGNGNFSLALSRNFAKILAIEIAKQSVNLAQHNIMVNNIDNVQIIRMSVAEFTKLIKGVRTFKRMNNVSIDNYQCNTVFLDPPRCGLDDYTNNLVQNYPKIIYISCNPESLCRDLVTLTVTHNIENIALFDQFPYTNHIECGVILVKKKILF